jgi:hypothetical protein
MVCRIRGLSRSAPDTELNLQVSARVEPPVPLTTVEVLIIGKVVDPENGNARRALDISWDQDNAASGWPFCGLFVPGVRPCVIIQTRYLMPVDTRATLGARNRRQRFIQVD